MRSPKGQVPGELRTGSDEQVIMAKAFIHDVSPSGMGISIESPIKIGTSVVLTLKTPHPLTIAGEVIWCSQFDVHSLSDGEDTEFQYRAGIKFKDEAMPQLEELKRYCLSLQ